MKDKQNIEVDSLSSTTSPLFLQTRLNKVLSFGCFHIPEVPSYAKNWDDEIDPVILLQDKILAEGALLALLVSRGTNHEPETTSLLNKFVTELNRIARDSRQKILLLRYPQTIAPFGLTHAALTALGYPDEEMQHIVNCIFFRNFESTIERIPYRTMEMRWVRSLIQPEIGFEIDNLLPHTILGTRAHPFSMSREDVYAITHAIMYATRFGEIPAPEQLDVEAILSQIDSCLCWVLVAEDIDLMIELILSATLLRRTWSPYVRFAWDWVCDIWLEFDFLPSPSFVTSELKKRSGISETAYIFQNIYHTMFVAGLLCSSLLTLPQQQSANTRQPLRDNLSALAGNCRTAANKASRLNNNDTQNSAKAKDLPSKEVLVEVLASLSVTHTRWQLLLTSPILDFNDMMRILADCALIEAVRAYDIPKVLTCLDEAIKINGPISLTVYEGIDFLIRQQLIDGSIGAHFIVPALRSTSAAVEIAQIIADSLTNYAERLEINYKHDMA